MIRYLKHYEIDKQKWDHCIARSVNQLIYAYSWYLDVVCPGWEALVKNEYEAVFPLTCKKKFGIDYLAQPFFTQQLGIFSTELISREMVSLFLEAVPENFRFIEINLNVANTFPLENFFCKQNLNLELSLDSAYENLYKNYSENVKRNIKKANRARLAARKNIPFRPLVQLFRKTAGKKIKNFGEKEYETLARLVYVCMEKGIARTTGAFTENQQLCAGIIWLITPGRAIFFFSAIDEMAKKNGAMPFLIDRFIEEYSGKKMILDFEGSNNKGLARFYRSFGSSDCVYLQIRKNKLPMPIRWLKK